MDRDKPRKHKTLVKAVREMCIQCMGGRNSGQKLRKLISECPSPDCPVFDFRFGKTGHHQNLSQEQKKVLANRAINSPLIQRVAGKSRPNLNDTDVVDT
jgi:hypothetical protein